MHSRYSLYSLVVLRLLGWFVVASASLPAQNTPERADSLFSRAERYYETGHPDSALLYFRSVLPIDRALGDREGEANALYNIGLIYAETGLPDSALLSYRPALAIHIARQDREGEAKVLSTIGEIFHTMGLADSSFHYYRAALRLRRAVADRKGEAQTINNIGNVYLHLGRLDSALLNYRAALVPMRQAGDKGGEANVLTNIGTILLDQGQADSALSTYRGALRLARTAADLRSEAHIVGAIGNAFFVTGPPDSALHYYHARKRFAYALDDREAAARVFNNIGEIYVGIDRADSALFHYRVALPLWRVVRNRAGEARTLRNIGYLLAVAGTAHNNLFLAAQYYDSATAIYAALRTHSGADANAVSFAEEQRTTFDQWAYAWLMHASRVTGTERESAISSALSAAERGRAQGLRQLLTAGAADARPAKLPRTSSTSTPLFDANSSADTVPGADLVAEATQLLAPLRKAHTAALYYLFGPDSLTIWLLEPAGSLRMLRSVSVRADSLAHLVTTLRRGVGADAARSGMVRGIAGGADQEPTVLTRGVTDEGAISNESTLRAARVLSAQLVPADLLRSVPFGSELVIVPHGMLGLVPFAALTMPGDSIPLGIRYSLRYAPSLRALNAAEQKSVAGTFSLMVADPTMPLVNMAAGNRVRLRDLPSAREEGTKVAQLFGAPLLAGSAATETEVRRQMPQARFVHLATHGLAFGSEARVRDSYVALAADSVNDGLFTIGELIDEIPSLSADLVVLSACQTGLGNLKEAEGTVGFQRAFLAKGARSVLVSLWSVDDKATALLMERFYVHWLGRNQQPAVSKAEALRQAQADVRSRTGYESPRYWAAFQLVGAR